MNKFKLVAPFSPDGDQPHAIKQLSAGSINILLLPDTNNISLSLFTTNAVPRLLILKSIILSFVNYLKS